MPLLRQLDRPRREAPKVCHRISRRRASYISVNLISNVARRDTPTAWLPPTAPSLNLRMVRQRPHASFEARSLLALRVTPH
jgi:hypothetical protein